MSQLIGNMNFYNITTENEIAVILSRFNSEYIFDVIKDNLTLRFNNYMPTSNPNMVSVFEMNFKTLMNTYPSDRDNILAVRQETYQSIINILCREYNLQFNDPGDINDYFGIAFYLYDFLLANFNIYVTQYFANFIYKEKNNLYDSLNMEALKKNKDSSTIYNKKIYKDVKLAVLNANLEYVLKSISQFDITFENILQMVYGNNKNIIGCILTYVTPVNDFYKVTYCGLLQSDISALILTNIRLAIQKLIVPDMVL